MIDLILLIDGKDIPLRKITDKNLLKIRLLVMKRNDKLELLQAIENGGIQ